MAIQVRSRTATSGHASAASHGVGLNHGDGGTSGMQQALRGVSQGSGQISGNLNQRGKTGAALAKKVAASFYEEEAAEKFAAAKAAADAGEFNKESEILTDIHETLNPENYDFKSKVGEEHRDFLDDTTLEELTATYRGYFAGSYASATNRSESDRWRASVMGGIRQVEDVSDGYIEQGNFTLDSFTDVALRYEELYQNVAPSLTSQQRQDDYKALIGARVESLALTMQQELKEQGDVAGANAVIEQMEGLVASTSLESLPDGFSEDMLQRLTTQKIPKGSSTYKAVIEANKEQFDTEVREATTIRGMQDIANNYSKQVIGMSDEDRASVDWGSEQNYMEATILLYSGQQADIFSRLIREGVGDTPEDMGAVFTAIREDGTFNDLWSGISSSSSRRKDIQNTVQKQWKEYSKNIRDEPIKAAKAISKDFAREYDAFNSVLTEGGYSSAQIQDHEYAQPIQIQEIRVIDGDTVEATIDGRREKIRFQGYNADEMDSTEGKLARAEVEQMVQDGALRVSLSGDRDKYGRLLATPITSSGDTDERFQNLGPQMPFGGVAVVRGKIRGLASLQRDFNRLVHSSGVDYPLLLDSFYESFARNPDDIQGAANNLAQIEELYGRMTPEQIDELGIRDFKTSAGEWVEITLHKNDVTEKQRDIAATFLLAARHVQQTDYLSQGEKETTYYTNTNYLVQAQLVDIPENENPETANKATTIASYIRENMGTDPSLSGIADLLNYASSQGVGYSAYMEEMIYQKLPRYFINDGAVDVKDVAGSVVPQIVKAASGYGTMVGGTLVTDPAAQDRLATGFWERHIPGGKLSKQDLAKEMHKVVAQDFESRPESFRSALVEWNESDRATPSQKIVAEKLLGKNGPANQLQQWFDKDWAELVELEGIGEFRVRVKQTEDGVITDPVFLPSGDGRESYNVQADQLWDILGEPWDEEVFTYKRRNQTISRKLKYRRILEDGKAIRATESKNYTPKRGRTRQ